MLRLGVSGDIVPRRVRDLGPAEAERLASLGVSVLGTHFEDDPQELAGGAGDRARKLLGDFGITISQVTGNRPNLVHPDDEVHVRAIGTMRASIDAAVALGAGSVLTGCGSRSATHPYGPHRDNFSPSARQRLVDSLREIADHAAVRRVVVALESHVSTTLHDAPTIAAIMEEVDSPWIRVNFDPVNLLGDLDSALNSGVRVLDNADRLASWLHTTAHAKDIAVRDGFVVHIDEVMPGDGILDWDAFFDVAGRMEQCDVIVEHLSIDDVERGVDRVRVLAQERGYQFR